MSNQTNINFQELDLHVDDNRMMEIDCAFDEPGGGLDSPSELNLPENWIHKVRVLKHIKHIKE